MSLPYGYNMSAAEFEGLLAGLSAAHDMGVRSLAVQVGREVYGLRGLGLAVYTLAHSVPCVLCVLPSF